MSDAYDAIVIGSGQAGPFLAARLTAADHEIVAANLFDGVHRRVSDRIPAYALFTDPPLARIGMTEAQVRATGRPALVGFVLSDPM